MGQMTFAVMLGVKKTAPAKLGEDGWHKVLNAYNHGCDPERGCAVDEPSGDGDRDIIGIWIAVGASGEDDVPDFDTTGFRLDAFDKVTEYKVQLAAARKEWKRFAAWMEKEHKIKLASPALYLVQTEVA